MAPRIAIAHDWMTGFAGGEQVVLALHKMFPEAPIYTSLYNPEKMQAFAGATIIPSYLQRIPLANKKDKLLIPLMAAAFESFDLKEFDVVISSGAFAKGVITHPGQLHINYCHTPIRYFWNLGGDNRNKGKWDSWLREAQAHKLRIWDVVSAERPDVMLANSTTVQARIAKIYRRDSAVVYPPVNIDSYAVSTANGGYYLMVSRLVAYKRPDIVIEACKKLGRPLKIVGTGPEEANLRALAAGVPNIEFLGRVSDADRDALYANAKAFVFGAEEDFGIVPVEAMACGKPVICFARGGQTDAVLDGKQGVHFAVQTGDSVAEAIARFETLTFDPASIRVQAEKFSTALFEQKIRQYIEFQS